MTTSSAASNDHLMAIIRRHWSLVGLLAGVAASLGFQAFPPARRLDAIERVNARQDSVMAAEVAAQRQTLDTIRRQVGQLLAGQCVKERDRMARLLYECQAR